MCGEFPNFQNSFTILICLLKRFFRHVRRAKDKGDIHQTHFLEVNFALMRGEGMDFIGLIYLFITEH